MTAPHTCRVAVCDDVPAFRELLAVFIGNAEGLSLVGEAANGVEAIDLAREHMPDVMLLDLAMPVMDGMEALPQILAASPRTRVIMLTGFGSERIKGEALSAGAAQYLEKGEPPGAIISVVRAEC